MTFDVKQLIDRIQEVVHKETNTVLNEASRDFLGATLMQTWESARKFYPGQDDWLRRHVEALEERNELDNRRGVPLGFGPIDIESDHIERIPIHLHSYEPQEPYRLMIPSTIAAKVRVNDLVVWEKDRPQSVLLSSNPITGVAFIETASNCALQKTRADGKVELTVHNISMEKIQFMAVLWSYKIDLAKEFAEEQRKKK